MIVEVKDYKGDPLKVTVNQSKRTFTLYGYKVKLKRNSKSISKVYPSIFYHIMMNNQEYRTGIVVHDLKSKWQRESFEAFHNDISEDELSRTGNNIYEAAIKMLTQII